MESFAYRAVLTGGADEGEQSAPAILEQFDGDVANELPRKGIEVETDHYTL